MEEVLSEERQLMKLVGIFRVGIFRVGIFRGEMFLETFEKQSVFQDRLKS